MALDGTLIILNGRERIREIDLSLYGKERLSFGREPSNDVVISSNIVSKFHGFFQFIEGSWCIYDNNSTNGFYINDDYFGVSYDKTSRIHRLADGDIIRIDNEAAARMAESGIIMLFTSQKRAGTWKECYLDRTGMVRIGRSRTNDIRLENVRVSREHATLIVSGDRVFIRDNKSSNGTFVNGELVTTDRELHERDVIRIGNSIMLYTKHVVMYKSESGGTRVLMQGVNREVKVKGGYKKILNNVNIQIEPNDFVAIIGGSGSGKTTIMNAMSGYEQATSGNVFVNSVDLYKNYKFLKSTIGYVPQQDIIYENLRLSKMLEYSAKLRMVGDVSAEERAKRVAEVLEMVDLTEHKDKMIRSLSGGQKKRASIAVELLGDPGLFFLDEPTSGLDPGTEENLMKSLKKLSKTNNKTIIMVTHTTQNLHLCDKIILMGANGNICFYGTAEECVRKFGVKNLTEVYNHVTDMHDVRRWADDYYRNYGITQRFMKTAPGKVPTPKKESGFKQARILTARYTKLIFNDKQRLLMLFLQPILISFLLKIVANDEVFTYYNKTQPIIFALSCAAIWVGLFNSIQEVCKERTILRREYMANLKLSAYIASKLIVQFAVSILQALIMVGFFTVFIGKPNEGLMWANPVPEIFLTVLLTIFAASCLGILVSSISKNNDKAMTVAPFLLIIQLLFSGILFELTDVTKVISHFTISKWSVSALGSTGNLNNLNVINVMDGEKIETARSKTEPLFDFVTSNISNAWLAMGAMIVVCTVVSMIILRNISKDTR